LKNWLIKLCLIGLFSLTIFSSVLSFPSKWRLFELKYGYRTSCNACHLQGGGTENNDYGTAFHRQGENFKAFAAIENLDSDQDGASNIAEINAKSNPGDPRSTPARPGNFLSVPEEEFIPKKLLEQLFPDQATFKIRYATLDSLTALALEKKVGLNLTEDERVPTFYEAYSAGAQPEKIGAALLFFEMENHKHLIGGIACDTAGKIIKLAVFLQQVKKGLPLSEFAAQFAGKSAGSGFKLGQDLQPIPKYPAFSQKLADYARKSLHLIAQFALSS
jgi:hypothetical protein